MRPIVSGDSLFLGALRYIVYGGVILFFGKSIFIPVSFALLISFVLYPVCRWLEDRGFHAVTAIVLCLTGLMLLGVTLVGLLVYQFAEFLEEWPVIHTNVTTSLTELGKWIETLGLSLQEQEAWLSRLSEQSGGGIVNVIGRMLSVSASSVVLLILIPVYTALILYHRRYWMKILARIFPNARVEDLRHMIMLTIETYYRFIKGMAVVYLVVGVLNSAGLLLLGVPHAILFGFIASILTFIPYVGIMVGSLLPMAMAWLTYDSVWYPLGVAGVFVFVQYLEANIIFPVAVSRRLNVNTLVMLAAMFAGGILWGVAGMILFVPFIGIAKLLADHNARWKTLSMILGTEPTATRRNVTNS
jgi:predicted PurR-regulated permease PerM